MKYYSEKTKKLYDKAEELIEAEKALTIKEKEKEALKAKRAERAEEIDNAIKEAAAAQKKVNELMDAFVKDYGTYHKTFNSDTVSLLDPFKPLDWFFNL